MTNSYAKRKHAHLKKPLGNIKYEVVEKTSKPTSGCGFMGDVYEIKIHNLEDDTYLYVNADDWCYYSLSRNSIFEVEYGCDLDIIESFEGFENTKMSQYYDFFLEMERFIDGIVAIN